MGYLIRLIISGFVLVGLDRILPGFSISGYWIGVLFILVTQTFGSFLRKLFTLVSLPIVVVTLGIFYFLINLFVLWLMVQLFSPSIQVVGLFNYVLVAITMSLIGSILKSGN